MCIRDSGGGGGGGTCATAVGAVVLGEDDPPPEQDTSARDAVIATNDVNKYFVLRVMLKSQFFFFGTCLIVKVLTSSKPIKLSLDSSLF